MAKNKLTEDEVKSMFVALINSCQEGLDGTWDCSTEEGRESFEPMYEDARALAKHFGVDISEIEEKEYLVLFTGTYTVKALNEEEAKAKWEEADFGFGEDLDIADITEKF